MLECIVDMVRREKRIARSSICRMPSSLVPLCALSVLKTLNGRRQLGVVRSATAVSTWNVSISGQKTASFKSQRPKQMTTKEWTRPQYPGVAQSVVSSMANPKFPASTSAFVVSRWTPNLIPGSSLIHVGKGVRRGSNQSVATPACYFVTQAPVHPVQKWLKTNVTVDRCHHSLADVAQRTGHADKPVVRCSPASSTSARNLVIQESARNALDRAARIVTAGQRPALGNVQTQIGSVERHVASV